LAQWRQEVRNNGSADLKVSCAAGRVVEAATAPSRLPVVGNAGDSAAAKTTYGLERFQQKGKTCEAVRAGNFKN